MMGPTRRPIRYLSGLSPIQALSLSCLITYSGSDIGGRVHKRHVRAHAGQPRTRVHTCTHRVACQQLGESAFENVRC